jgi:thioredoxin-related protein
MRVHLVLLLSLALNASSLHAAEINWHQDVNQAWAKSLEKKRPLLVVFTVPNCFYCAKLKKETLSDSTIAAQVNGQFEPVQIDGQQHPALMKKLGVDGYPTTLLITPAGVVASRIEGYETPQELNPKLLSALEATRVDEQK